MTSSTTSKRAAMWALLSLAIGSFGIGMTEFVIMGLLPNIAQESLPNVWAVNSDDAIARAGWLISLYALGVVVGAPTIAGAVARFPRHRVMIVLALALTVFNFSTVVAPSFELIAVSRFLAGLPHGAYFGIGALVAADILGPGKRAKGVAFVLTGLTVANVVGVPLGTWLGQVLGWRAAFVVVAAIFALATVAIAVFVPRSAGDPSRTMAAELRVFRIGQVWLAVATGAIGFGGFFALYSYVAPLITDVAGAPEWAVPIVLVIIGIGMTIGNILGGHLADLDLKRTLLGGFLAVGISLVGVVFTASWIVPLAIFVCLGGLTSSILSPSIQTRLMDVAKDNQSIAAALNHSALNSGNSLGAFLGGATIAAGWGFRSPAVMGVLLALAGFGVALLAYRLEARSRAAARAVAAAR